MVLRRSSVVPPFVVHVEPVGGPQPDHGARHMAALVLIVEPGRPHRINPGLVATTLELTPAETQVAVGLAEGNSVRDMADGTGHTPFLRARTQLSSPGRSSRPPDAKSGYRLAGSSAIRLKPRAIGPVNAVCNTSMAWSQGLVPWASSSVDDATISATMRIPRLAAPVYGKVIFQSPLWFDNSIRG